MAKFALANEPRHNEEQRKMVGLGRFELPTSPLSGVRSNQLSYRPAWERLVGAALAATPIGPKRPSTGYPKA